MPTVRFPVYIGVKKSETFKKRSRNMPGHGEGQQFNYHLVMSAPCLIRTSDEFDL